MMLTRLRDEEGAIGILAAASIAMLVMAAALAVDLGRLAYSSREVQGDADRAAFDAARVLGDLRDPSADALVAAQSVVAGSMGVNTFGDGFYDSQVVTVEVGEIDGSGNFVAWSGGPNPPTAVRVTNQVWVPFVFAVGSGGRTVARTAVVEIQPEAPIAVGTTVATVSSDEADLWDELFGDLVQGSVNLGVAGWQGLADADVSLGDLLSNLGITAGSPDTVLAVDVPLTDLFTALETTLTAEADPGEADAITALTSLGAATAADLELTLADIIEVVGDDVADAASRDISVPVLHLAQAGVQSAVANGNQAVTLTVPVSISGITSATLTLGMIESQQTAVGPARWDATLGDWKTIARTSQLRLQADLVMEDLLNLAGLLPIDVNLSLLVDAGRGRAALTELVCRTPVANSSLDIETITGTVGLHLGAVDPATLIDGTLAIAPIDEATLLTASDLLGTPLLELDGATDLSLGSSTRTDTMVGPFPVTTSGGSTAPGLADLLDPASMSVTATVLGALPVTVEDVQNELDLQGEAPLTSLQTDVIEPLLKGLGVELGVADTTALENPDCGKRALVE